MSHKKQRRNPSIISIFKYAGIAFVIFLVLSLAIPAQETSTATDTKKEEEKNTETSPSKKSEGDQQQGQLDLGNLPQFEEEPPPVEELRTGSYVYNPEGRRDPFWDISKGKNVKIKREAKEGLAGLLIDELELEGIILVKTEYIAVFKGPDGKPYDVRTGDSVYDGEVIKIDWNSVVFKRLLTVALGGTKEKIIIKKLSPEEEAEKK